MSRKRTTGLLAISAFVITLAACAQEARSPIDADVPQSPNALIGAGNFDNGTLDKNAELKFQLLKSLGAVS